MVTMFECMKFTFSSFVPLTTDVIYLANNQKIQESENLSFIDD